MYVVWEWAGLLAAPCHFHFAQLSVMLFDTRIHEDRGLGCPINNRLVNRQWVTIFGHIILVSYFCGLSCCFLPKIGYGCHWVDGIICSYGN